MLHLSQLLKRMGFSTTHNGYKYCRLAILLVFNDPSLAKQMTSKLYPYIAQTYHVSVYSVERCMRNAIESAWLRGDMKFNHCLFQYSIDFNKGKPTNSEFISVMVEYLRMHGYQIIIENYTQLSLFE